MRTILSISLPDEQKKLIEKRAKKAKLTISTYVLHAIELKESLIQEDEILDQATEAEREYRAGRAKKLSSLSDLM
jgi:predicted DNA-binding protein